ncbi:hypothetical protein GY03_07105 [Proteus vulgaris]|uniref:hypothetical protein n=1 Tax=Proteus vulgaris TaxID=585 RepID=UPI0021B09C56|nr:hypothetical protein [Proteus vulgaris]MCT6517039.1 hypothetical protein [Proteus vulgaris]
MKKLFILALIFTLSACATPEKWQAKTIDPSPLDIAKNVCMQEAKARYPARYVTSNQTPFSPMRVNGKDIPNAGTSFPSDVNEWGRKDYFNTCMRAEGWENKNKVTGLLAFLFN